MKSFVLILALLSVVGRSQALPSYKEALTCTAGTACASALAAACMGVIEIPLVDVACVAEATNVAAVSCGAMLTACGVSRRRNEQTSPFITFKRELKANSQGVKCAIFNLGKKLMCLKGYVAGMSTDAYGCKILGCIKPKSKRRSLIKKKTCLNCA